MCAYLSCPTAFVVAVMSGHTQSHTLTTYGVNKLQAIAQGLNWSEVREREKRGRKLEGKREVTGHGARQLASVELSIALWLRILWPQVNSLTNAEHIYLFTSAAVAVAISISNSSSSSPTAAPAPSSLVCRTCRVFVQLANSKQIKNKQQPETRTTTITITIGATTTITSSTNSYVTEQNRTWSKAQPKML